jgi:hypothetical protein
MSDEKQREVFLNSVKVLMPHEDDYIIVCEANQYEIIKVTPERVNADGTINQGAVMVAINQDPVRWIPKSVLGIDSQETLYIQNWFFEKNF